MAGNREYAAASAELVPGALRGYRTWRVGINDDSLWACNFETAWTPGVQVAECMYLRGQAPDVYKRHPIGEASPLATCSCGFYAVHEPGNRDNRGGVLGSIKAYGKVVIGTIGFRAAKVEIEGLCLPPMSRHERGSPGCGVPHCVDCYPTDYPTEKSFNTLKVIGRLYGVPVFRTPDELMEAFPPIPVNHLIQDALDQERQEREEKERREAEFRLNGYPQFETNLRWMEETIKGMFPSTLEAPKKESK